jgi:heme/copper-type cytochrome/quinol oxidase subunit 2
MKLLLAVLAAGATSGALVTAGAIALGTTPAQKPAENQRIVIHVTRSGLALPSDLVVRPGLPVTLVFVNPSRMPHSFDAPELGVNQIIPPGRPGRPSRTVLTFTAARGVYQWWCAVPCGDRMGGRILAVVAPPE